jgi:hypothetical protein
MHIRMMPELIERRAAASGLVVHEASICFWVAQKFLLVAKKAALCSEIAIASLSTRDPTGSVNRDRLPSRHLRLRWYCNTEELSARYVLSGLALRSDGALLF